MSNKLELGQAVVVKDAGYAYPFCIPAAEKLNLSKFVMGGGISVADGERATVRALPEYFPEANLTLMGLTLESGQEIVIDPQGVSV